MWAREVLQNGNKKGSLMLLPKGNGYEGACLWQLGSRQGEERHFLPERDMQANKNRQYGGCDYGEEDDK